MEIVTTLGTFTDMQDAAKAGVEVLKLYGPFRGSDGKMSRYEDKETYNLLSQ